MKTNYKIICITAISVMGLVPAMSDIHSVPDQPDLPNHVMVSELSPGIGDDLHKALIPPMVFDATATMTSGSITTWYSS